MLPRHACSLPCSLVPLASLSPLASFPFRILSSPLRNLHHLSRFHLASCTAHLSLSLPSVLYLRFTIPCIPSQPDHPSIHSHVHLPFISILQALDVLDVVFVCCISHVGMCARFEWVENCALLVEMGFKALTSWVLHDVR